jgi:hypothetical protein
LDAPAYEPRLLAPAHRPSRRFKLIVTPEAALADDHRRHPENAQGHRPVGRAPQRFLDLRRGHPAGNIIRVPPVSLAFLLPTSMGRTVSVFMAPAVVTTAHLLSLLLDGRDGTGTEHTSRVVGSTHRIPVRRRRSDGLDA